MKKLLLTTVFTTLLAIPAQAATTYVDVNGMVCDFCAQALNKVFLKEESVESIDVNLDEQVVIIHYKEGMEPLDDESVDKMVYWAGYDVVAIRHEDD